MRGWGRWVALATFGGAGLAALGISSAGGDERPMGRAAHVPAVNFAVATGFESAGGAGVSSASVVWVARSKLSARRGSVGISLHGLPGAGTYTVFGSGRSCATDILDANFRLQFRTTVTSTGDDLATVERAVVRRPLRGLRSVHVYEREENAELKARGCAAIIMGGAVGGVVGA